jgi:CheY-like chemotaxis protein
MARILIVDDEISVRTTIQRALEFNGHAVVSAECGHSGAAAIEAFAFDVVLVDIFMPGIGGLETIRIFRDAAPTVPIIAMSGLAIRDEPPLPEFFQKAVDLGAACCLCKPFKAQKLMKAVDMCMSLQFEALLDAQALDAQVRLVRKGLALPP